MKQKDWKNQTAKFTTVHGSTVIINGDGHTSFIRDKETINYHTDLTVEKLKSLKSGGTLELKYDFHQGTKSILQIKDVKQSFSKEFIDSIGITEKNKEKSGDDNIGIASMIIPTAVVTMFEQTATALRMGVESVIKLEMIESLCNLPFPILYNLFQNLNDETRLYIAPFLAGIGFGIIGGKLVGTGINKLRYISAENKLNKKLKNEHPKIKKVTKDDFKQICKKRTAKQAYIDITEKYMIR